MKRNIIKFWMFIFITALISCNNEISETLDLTADVDIHSFVINGVEGIIDSTNSTISVILPAGTNLKGLSPVITVDENAQVTPNSGDLMDFVDNNGNLITVTYTVTNKNLYQKYYVSVDVARAKITSFKIGNVEGTIDDQNKKITLYLPVGTDVTKLIPIVEYTSGATLTPESGTAVDFTNPVNFTLNYLGSDFNYEATVILGEAPKPVITIYNGETVSPTWESIAGSVNNGYANPQTNGINTTSTCVSIMRNNTVSDAGGRAWSGGALWNSYKVNINPAEYSKFTLMILKTVAGPVQLEIQSTDGVKDWLKVDYSADHLGEWQELTFDIPASRTALINNILVAPHCTDATNFESQLMYWDELKVYPKE